MGLMKHFSYNLCFICIFSGDVILLKLTQAQQLSFAAVFIFLILKQCSEEGGVFSCLTILS